MNETHDSTLQQNIFKAIEDILSKKVTEIERTKKGEFNKVFIVTTEKNKYAVRIFRHTHWPEEGKLHWIEQQLTLHSIPHAKLLHYSRETNYFPHGFMISEYIHGINGSEAILSGKTSFAEYHQKLAQLLYQIHNINIDQYGLISNGKGEYPTLLEYKQRKLQSDVDKINSIPDFDISLTQQASEYIVATLNTYQSKLHPALVHGDATPDNTIYTAQGEIVLVDWDGALADCWIRDYSWITYWGSHMSEIGSLGTRQQMIKEAFSKFYPQTELTGTEIGELVKAYHLLQAIELIPYYYFDQKNNSGYEKTRNRLQYLLSTI